MLLESLSIIIKRKHIQELILHNFIVLFKVVKKLQSVNKYTIIYLKSYQFNLKNSSLKLTLTWARKSYTKIITITLRNHSKESVGINCFNNDSDIWFGRKIRSENVEVCGRPVVKD